MFNSGNSWHCEDECSLGEALAKYDELVADPSSLAYKQYEEKESERKRVW